MQFRVSTVDPAKAAEWVPILNRLEQDSSFPKMFLPLMKLNTLSYQAPFPRHLHLFGLNSDNIRDFNGAFMEFGVRRRQYHEFYRRVSTDFSSCSDSGGASLPEKFFSLRLVQECDFINFSKYWSDF